MAVFKIVRLNKMTCGNRRGLIDMDIQVQSIKSDIYLLPGTGLSGTSSALSDAGIITESNNDYEYLRNASLYDYYPKNTKSEILQERRSQQNNPTEGNVDTILNENQISIDLNTYNDQLSSHDGLSGSDAIQLTPEFWLLSSYEQQRVDQFNTQVSCMRVVFEFELDNHANEKALLTLKDTNTQLLPLNDLLDLCIKSTFKKAENNYAIPGNLLLNKGQMTHSKNVDQYFAFEQNPICFCQYKNDAFAISQPMTKQPYRLQSNLMNQVKSGIKDRAHSFALVQDDIYTVLYPGTDAYGTSTYRQYIEADLSRMDQPNIIDMLTPAVQVTGIDYNYIVEIEQNQNNNSQYDNPTIYDNGDIFGFFTVGKNMYNALYSMEMSSSYQISHCREYAGVQDMGSKVMLKYYDCNDYQISQPQNGQAKASLTSSETDDARLYPYQKVETFEPISFGYAAKHKSNLFSIKIKNTGLDNESLSQATEEERNIAQSMKKSIANGMKQLAESIAPANTQLFATYFISDE